MMSEIKLKQYNFRGSDIETRRKKTFKENFTQHYKQKIKLKGDGEHKHHHHHQETDNLP